MRDGAGGVENTTSASPAIYHAIAVKRGTLATAPRQGSRLADLVLQTASAPSLAEQYTELALQPLVDEGRLEHVNIVAEAGDPGTLLISVQARDLDAAVEVALGI